MNCIDNSLPSVELGVTLEENASSLTQGWGKKGFEQCGFFAPHP